MFTRLTLCLVILTLCACAGARNASEHYTPQNPLRFTGSVAIGVFSYQPFDDGRVRRATLLQNTADYPLELSENVAELVRRNTGYELYHSGVEVNQQAPLILTAKVVEFKVHDDLPPVTWDYSVEYTISTRDGQVKAKRLIGTLNATSARRYDLVSGYLPTINALVLAGYEEFFSDPAVRYLLSH